MIEMEFSHRQVENEQIQTHHNNDAKNPLFFSIIYAVFYYPVAVEITSFFHVLTRITRRELKGENPFYLFFFFSIKRFAAHVGGR